MNVVSAGVNHYAFMNSGTWGKRDLFDVFDATLKKLGRNYRCKLEEKFPGILGLSLGIMLEDYDRNGSFMV